MSLKKNTSQLHSKHNSIKSCLFLLSLLFLLHRPPDEDFLKSAREQRLKEVRMAEILKEIFTYFLFVLLLLMVAYGNRDTKAYLLRKNLHDIFVDVDQTGVDLADVCIKVSTHMQDREPVIGLLIVCEFY